MTNSLIVRKLSFGRQQERFGDLLSGMPLDRGAGVRLPRSEGDPHISKTRLLEATRGGFGREG
jgi:hypothetical protein